MIYKEKNIKVYCNVGDVIYFRIWGYSHLSKEYCDFIQHQTVTHIHIEEDFIYYQTASKGFTKEDIGKTIFLSYEEAVNELKQFIKTT